MAGENIPHEMERTAREAFRARVFRAIVVSVAGNKVNVRRLGYTTTEGPYPAAAGLAATLSGGETVVCFDIGGRPSVAYEEVT